MKTGGHITGFSVTLFPEKPAHKSDQ